MRRHEGMMFVPDGVNCEMMAGGNGALEGDVGRGLVGLGWSWWGNRCLGSGAFVGVFV